MLTGLLLRFELDAFWKEVRRVLAPGGAFAVWGYDLAQVPGNAAATQVLWDMENVILGPYWSDRRKLVSGHYKGARNCHQTVGSNVHLSRFSIKSVLSMSMPPARAQ